MKLSKILIAAFMAVLLITAVTACSEDKTAPKSDSGSKSGSGTGSGTGKGDGGGGKGGNVIDVDLSEFKLTPNKFTIEKGEDVTFKVTNDGTFAHNFTISDLGKTVAVEPGETGELEVTFDEAGTFDVVCTVPTHEDKGMTGEIEVK